MSQAFDYMEQVVNDAIHHTDSSIDSIGRSLIPYFVDVKATFIRKGRYRFDNDTIVDDDHVILKVENVKTRTGTITSKSDGIYSINAWTAINSDKEYPFILFVNDKHIPWSVITIVRDTRYAYFLLPKEPFKDPQTNVIKIKNVKYIYIPLKTFYTESAQKAPNDKYQKFLRFNDKGEIIENGKIIYYLYHPALKIKTFAFSRANLENLDLEVDSGIHLSKNNVLLFKNKLLDTTDSVTIDKFNLASIRCEEALYKLKVFYRTDINQSYNNISKFSNQELVKEISQGMVTNKALDTSILNQKFDFDVTSGKTYEQNIKSGFRYLSSYDSTFIKKVYDMDSCVETKVYTGKEIKEKLNVHGILNMMLSKYKTKDTRVLIFCNGLLYHRYSYVSYTINHFNIPIDTTTLKDDDVFEIVFLKNINNFSTIINYTQENKFKEQQPFEDDKLLLYTRHPKGYEDRPGIELNDRSWFEVPFTIDEQGNVNVDEFYDGTDLLYTTKNQFKYCYRLIHKPTVKVRLTNDFEASTNPDQYLVFINGRILNREFYRLIVPKIDNEFTDPYVYTRIKLNPGDKVEVIYGPIEFKNIDYSGNLVTKMVNLTLKKDQVGVQIPYPFKMYSYKHNFILFLNGTYVVPDRYKISKDKLVFTDGTVLLSGNVLTFTFVYDKSEELESCIYINNSNDIYMESVSIPIESDGQREFRLDDKYIEYLIEGNNILVTYKGLYVPNEFWSVDQYTGVITFASNVFKSGEHLKVIVFHIPAELEKAEKLIQTTSSTDELNAEILESYPAYYTTNMDSDKLIERGSAYATAKALNNAVKFICNRETTINGSKSKVTSYHFNITELPQTILDWGNDIAIEKLIGISKAIIDDGRNISELLNELPYSTNHQETVNAILEANENGTLDKALKLYGNYLISNLCNETILAESVYGGDEHGLLRKQTKLIALEDQQTVMDNLDEDTMPITSSTQEMSILDREDAKLIAKDTVSRDLESINLGYFRLNDYVESNSPIFVMKNGVLLKEGYHYTLDSLNNKIKFTNPLLKDDIVYLLSYSIKNHAVKSYEHTITVEDVDKKEYDLYEQLGDLTHPKSRFIVYMGSVLLDSSRYTMGNDCILRFNDDVTLLKGMHIRIICLYVDAATTRTEAAISGSSRYHEMNHIKVPFEEGVFTYFIPYPQADDDSDFIIMCGGLLVDESRYTVNLYDKTITFNDRTDLMFTSNTEFEFVFINDDVSHINVEVKSGELVNDSRTYDIPVPYENYFECGNSILVFNNGILLNEDKYTINTQENTITLNEDNILEDSKLEFVFVFNNSTKNVSTIDEDITISVIRKNGYIFMNKDKLEHPLSKSLVWLFMNGKKVSVNDITDISSNVLRINKDQQSRYNLMMLSHTPKLKELDTFFKNYSNYDTLINNLSSEDLNILFNNHRILSDTEPHHDMNIHKDALATEIMRDWYGRTGYYAGTTFRRGYQDPTKASDIQFDEQTGEYHSMVADASKFFSVNLDRSDTNKRTVEE